MCFWLESLHSGFLVNTSGAFNNLLLESSLGSCIHLFTQQAFTEYLLASHHLFYRMESLPP